MSCFSQGSAATLFRLGWRVYNNILMLNFFSGFCAPKIIKSVHFSPSYSTYKRRGRFLDTMYWYRPRSGSG